MKLLLSFPQFGSQIVHFSTTNFQFRVHFASILLSFGGTRLPLRRFFPQSFQFRRLSFQRVFQIPASATVRFQIAFNRRESFSIRFQSSLKFFVFEMLLVGDFHGLTQLRLQVGLLVHQDAQRLKNTWLSRAIEKMSQHRLTCKCS